jgi:hypothetical protein
VPHKIPPIIKPIICQLIIFVLAAKTAALSFNDNGLDNFMLIPKLGEDRLIEIDYLPGFKKILIKRAETNFKQLFVDIELYPTEILRKILPIFEYDSEKHDFKLKTVAAYNLEDNSTLVISILLKSSIETKIFGRFNFIIRAINIKILNGIGNQVEIVGEFNLGLKNFLQVGGRIILTQSNTSQDWSFDIHMDKIEGSLAISDELKIYGYLRWGDEFPDQYYEDPNSIPRRPVNKDDLIGSGSSRRFYGILQFDAPKIFGKFEIFALIGSENGASFWVCGINYGGAINLGFGKLSDPELILSKNSDLCGQISTIVANLDQGVKALRKPEGETRKDWLKKWKYSDKTDFTFVLSGYLKYGNITSTQSGDKFTAILYSTSGLLRIEGWLKILNYDINVIFAYDLQKKRLLAGFQLPRFDFPPESGNSATLIFQPGLVMFGTNFGGNPYFLWSFGWPPQTGGTNYERDWSKANMASWNPPSFPIPNVIAGGLKFEYDGNSIVLGVAIKAGWRYGINFEVGSASISVTLGGLLIVRYSRGTFTNQLSQQDRFSSYLQDLRKNVETRQEELISNKDNFYSFDDDINRNYLLIKHNLEMSRDRVDILGEVFVDVHGDARIEIFGVTLCGVSLDAFARMRVCGNTEAGITYIGGSYGVRACVKIGCSTFCKDFTISIVVKNGPCLAAYYNLIN